MGALAFFYGLPGILSDGAAWWGWIGGDVPGLPWFVAGFGLFVLCLTGVAVFRSEGKEVLKRRRRDVQPTEAVDDVLGVAVECGQQPITLPLAPKEPEVGRFFYIHDVLMTNRTPAPVSLVPSLVIDLLDGSHAVLDQKGFVLLPKGFTAGEMLLHGPLDIDPSRSLRGDLGFTLMGSEEKILFGADFNRNVKRVGPGLPVMYLVLRDLVSGKEIAQEVTHRHMRSSAGALAELQERNRRVPQPIPSMTTTEAVADLIMEARAMRERVDTFGYQSPEDEFTLAWEAEAWANRTARFLEKYVPALRNLFRRPQVSLEAQHVASYLEGGMAELNDIQGRHSEKSFPASEFDDFRPKPDEWMGEEEKPPMVPIGSDHERRPAEPL